MAELEFQDSAYRFTDPIRYFKANDPYYFEIDNIPLKQLQENCLWLKDQLRQVTPELRKVKRGDIDELRPFATGGDRTIRVNPGRYTARVNDASIRSPLSFLTKIAGGEVGEIDGFSIQIPNNVNSTLSNILDNFKQSTAAFALSVNGLETRLLTWPVYSVDSPIDGDGVNLEGTSNYVRYSSSQSSGRVVAKIPAVISEAIQWAKNNDNNTFSLFRSANGSVLGSDDFAVLPLLESHFIKYWRGATRTAVVDVDEELTIDVPPFDSRDFSYIDENGNTQAVEGVASRIDLVFIYTKPVDATETTILKPSGKEVITKPQLGIIQGAGIRARYGNNPDPKFGYKENVTDTHKILASPGDSDSETIGFTATSGNDIAFDVRGSFPTPDDILNLAPLLSERLEDSAIELVGQSILPVAYVWVKNEGPELTNGSVPVLTTDVIDIRPFFRTTELAYNERAGIAGAMPQLSLANPAVGKAQLDYEVKRTYDDVLARIQEVRNLIPITDIDGDVQFSPLDNLIGDLTIPLEEPVVFFSIDAQDGEIILAKTDENLAPADLPKRYDYESPIRVRGWNANITPALLARPEVTSLLGPNLERLSDNFKVYCNVRAVQSHLIEAGDGVTFTATLIDGDFANASVDAPLDYTTLLESQALVDRSTNNYGGGTDSWPITKSITVPNFFPYHNYLLTSTMGSDSYSSRNSAERVASVRVRPVDNKILLHTLVFFYRAYSTDTLLQVDSIKLSRY